MATWQAVNVLTGAVEKPKYNEICVVAEIWTVTLGSSTATGDTISGPVLPAGTYLMDVKTDWGALGSGATQEAGYASHLAAFIAASNTTPAAGGIQGANVAGTLGFTSTTDTTILVTLGGTFTAASSTKLTIAITYTANP